MREQGIQFPARKDEPSQELFPRSTKERGESASLRLFPRVSPLSSRTRPLSVGLLRGRFRLRSCDSAWLGASSMMSSSASEREFQFPARAFERGFSQISV